MKIIASRLKSGLPASCNLFWDMQDGKILRIENLSHPDLRFSVISLDPPPLVLDRKIKGLKRIELRIPSWTVKGRKNVIKVKLTK